MENYKNILLAVDLHENCDENIISQAIKMAREHGAKLTLLHAVEHLNAYGVAQAYPSIIEVEGKLMEEARASLQKIIAERQIEKVATIVESGSPKMIILDYAKAHDIDLIVLGSHGRHGINMLLGSTANAVLHHAQCDVLAVRIQSK